MEDRKKLNDTFSNVWAYDIEVLRNCFTFTAVNMVDIEKKKVFVIWEKTNQALECINFIKSCYGMIGYNNIDFDYPILHMCMMIRPTACQNSTGRELASYIYGFTQKYLQDMREGKFLRVKHIVPQRDVYRIWHFDNEAKRTSLKWIECAMRWHSVEEMPYEHHYTVKTTAELDAILKYNLNDVLATRHFYLEKTLPKVRMRKVLSQKFKLRLENANDAKIGEDIILAGVAQRRGIDRWDLNNLKTRREYVDLKDVILPHVKFKSKEFQKILTQFQSMRITDTRKKEEISVIFDNLQYDFGFGGIHAARQGVFKNIWSCDVSSYYPNLAISFGFYPEHLGREFAEVYTQIYQERRKYPKGTPENEGLKLALNAVFGKSNSIWSPLYDPRMTMQITINGQLLLAMLCEELTLSGAAKVIMANTDGIEVDVKNEALYYQICKEWEKNNKLTLEHAQYKVIAIRDVNNYLAIFTNGHIKVKGAYEFDKEIHKDPSMRVVPLAVKEYFDKGTPVSEFINNHQDMWDFFLYVRAKTGEFLFRDILPDTGEELLHPAPKTIRYYIAKQGSVLVKHTEKKMDKVHRSSYVLPCNDITSMHFDMMPMMLNRKFYIQEAGKLIDAFYKKQEGLFA